MANVRIAKLDGGDVQVDTGEVEALQDALHGDLITPESPNYDDVRTIWNAMIDRRPALIAQCRNASDVMLCVDFAGTHDLLVSVRGAGHNIGGKALCDDGLMIDLSMMTSVQVDADARLAVVEPGATLADLDRETQKFGLATPLGINSTTGVAGLTLGGGFGWLTRIHGVTVDNLVAADVVTADGQLVRASAESHQDLFWAIRGGGGNFGVVTSFEFALHPVGPELLSGLIVFPFAQAQQVLRGYRDLTAQCPEELTVWFVLRKAPPLPFLPDDVHGKEVVVVPFIWFGDAAAGEKHVEQLLALGTPHGQHFGVQPYVDWQQAFDPLLTPGAMNYWKSHNFTELSDDALDTMIEYAGKLPSPQCEIFIGHVAGQANRVASDATAYANRDAVYVLNVHGRWDDPADTDACVAWAREFFVASTPFASGSVYVNFLTDEEGDRVGAAYGPNHKRLTEVKRKYDPRNQFRVNQNIKP